MNDQKKPTKMTFEEFIKHYYFQAFKDVYSSEEEMFDVCLKFQQIFVKSNRELRLQSMNGFAEFLSLSHFYRAMKLMKDDFTKLIMITSLIEKFNSKRDFLTFPEWLSEKKQKENLEQEKIEKIWNDYAKEMGCSSKFRHFFLDYLTKNEQVKLLTSILYQVNIDDNSEVLVPLFCFNEKVCKSKISGCAIGIVDKSCPAITEEKLLKKGIKEFAEYLYNLRNRFVHDARLFKLSSENRGKLAFLQSFIPYKFRYIKRPHYTGSVVFRLTATDLEKTFDRNFKKMFNKYISQRPVRHDFKKVYDEYIAMGKFE